MKENIFVRTIPMPMSVRAFTIPDASGDYNVYINEALSPEQQLKSFEHETRHIRNDDFFRDETAVMIENRMKKLPED